MSRRGLKFLISKIEEMRRIPKAANRKLLCMEPPVSGWEYMLTQKGRTMWAKTDSRYG